MNDDAHKAIDWSQGLPLTAGDYFLGIYQPSPETAGFWEGVARRELRAQVVRRTARPPSIRSGSSAPHADPPISNWKRAGGRGTVYSFSEVHHAPSGVSPPSVPYTVGLVRARGRRAPVHALDPGGGRAGRDRRAGAAWISACWSSDNCCPVFRDRQAMNRGPLARHPRARHDARAGRAAVHDGAGRSRRRCDQGRAAGRRRRDALLGPSFRRQRRSDADRLQPQQALGRARPASLRKGSAPASTSRAPATSSWRTSGPAR